MAHRLGTPASAGTRGRRPRNRATRLNATAHPVRERRPLASTRGWPSFICRLTPPADHRYRPEPPPPTLDIDRSPPGMAHRLGTPASAGTARRRRAAGRTGSCNGASLSARTPGRPRGAPTLDIDRSPPGMAHRLGTPASAGTARRRRAAGRTGSCNGASLSARTPGRPRGAPTLDIDRSFHRRPRISTGVLVTDPDIDRSLRRRPRISTGAGCPPAVDAQVKHLEKAIEASGERR